MSETVNTKHPDIHPELDAGVYHRLHRMTELAAPYIGRILTGKSGCSWDTACKLADAAGVSMNEFRAHIEAKKRARAKERAAHILAMRKKAS